MERFRSCAKAQKECRPGMVPGGVIEKMRFLPGGKRITTREVLWVPPKDDKQTADIVKVATWKGAVCMPRTRLDRSNEQHAEVKTLLWGNVKRDNANLQDGAAKLGMSASTLCRRCKDPGRELARIFNCNLDGSWYLVTLTYSDDAHEKLFGSMTEDQTLIESKRLAGLYVRRLKRKAGAEIKYAYTSSDREVEEDGSLSPVRVHNHVVICSADVEQLRECWSYGVIDVRSIYANQDDYTPLAVYLVQQVRSLPDYKKFNTSRNLEKPRVEERVVVGDPGDEMRVQPGAKVLDRMTYREGSVVQYVRYKRRPKAVKRGGHKEMFADTSQATLRAACSPQGEPLMEKGGPSPVVRAPWKCLRM